MKKKFNFNLGNEIYEQIEKEYNISQTRDIRNDDPYLHIKAATF